MQMCGLLLPHYVATDSICSAAKSRSEIFRAAKSWKATQGGEGVVPNYIFTKLFTSWMTLDTVCMKSIGGKDYKPAWQLSGGVKGSS